MNYKNALWPTDICVSTLLSHMFVRNIMHIVKYASKHIDDTLNDILRLIQFI